MMRFQEQKFYGLFSSPSHVSAVVFCDCLGLRLRWHWARVQDLGGALVSSREFQRHVGAREESEAIFLRRFSTSVSKSGNVSCRKGCEASQACNFSVLICHSIVTLQVLCSLVPTWRK